MRFNVTATEIKKANVPHELFLTNLIGNHILLAVALGGLAGSFPWVMILVPLISFSILGYTLWRAKRAFTTDTWYVMCHWQVCAKRSVVFLAMLSLLLVAMLLGWIGYAYGGMMKEAVLALVIGVGILPVMGTILVLIMFESDALYHANQAKLPAWVVQRFPNGAAEVIEETVPASHPAA
ncbi:hypothetical protein CKO25_15085 [Thiocapsa imhoffii]|uniref:Uncharacterized protein n=1 Tax=Thiocapsa imhoffii TaxID=382777 RepID=A0A9X1B9G9_9GAMM|nr:hypothetical protein [Thiocapsa imhoffii]MBK1645949.1 hypothetical protein [Thiocapsa imhoffii]